MNNHNILTVDITSKQSLEEMGGSITSEEIMEESPEDMVQEVMEENSEDSGHQALAEEEGGLQPTI